MSHNYAKGHTTGEMNTRRKNLEEVSMMLQQNLVLFRTAHILQKQICLKSYPDASDTSQRSVLLKI